MNKILTERISCCPACGGTASQFWGEARDRLYQTTSQVFEYNQCLDCRSLFQSCRPLECEVWKCYPTEYGPYASVHHRRMLLKLPQVIHRIANRLADRVTGIAEFRQKIHKVEKNLHKAKMMLDFGCGSGKYLDRVKKFGCTAIGMDFSHQALEQVRSRGHQCLAVDEAGWSVLGTSTIDFVRMNHVVEHLYQPEQVLKRIFSAMAAGAILHLSTPNPNGPSATKYRTAWWGLECPRHVVLLSTERMVALLEEIGFSQIEVLHEPIAKDMLRSWAYIQVDRGAIKNEIVEGLAQDGILNLRFSPVIAYAMRCSKGSDRYHVIARKTSSTN